MSDPQATTPQTEADLSDLGRKILAYWREYRPTMVQELEAEGGLLALVSRYQRQVAAATTRYQAQNRPQWQITELTTPIWRFPPESQQPRLGHDEA